MSNHHAASDADLVAQVIAGDIEVYGELMQRYETKLLRYVTYILSGDYASADVVQETFIKAYTNLRSYKSKYSFSAWIYRIAHNTAINVAKKHRRQVAMPDPEVAESLPEFSIPDTMADEVDEQLLGVQLQKSFIQLKPKYREPLLLNLVDGYGYQEIADILEIPINTVATRIRRAKQQMKLLLQAQGVSP
jgi:RNA polymerase sigma-70 factor (ECF subfamily)